MTSLEAESIEIFREAVAAARNPVMLFSVGKDSSVMLHLARKAFHPAPPPFPLLHVDTGWKFRAMYEHRDRMARESGMQLITHTNPKWRAEGVNPFTHGSAYHTDVMKTQALKQALDAYGYDVIFGGARRDEEKSRAKERIFSFRAPGHRWDPKAQRPELWNLYNPHIRSGETIRVFPISNWTEADMISGSTSTRRGSQSCRCIWRPNARWCSATGSGSWWTTRRATPSPRGSGCSGKRCGSARWGAGR